MTAQFTLDGQQPAHGSANSLGELPEAPVLPMITSDFTRTASAQINVTGLVGDDHPNTAPGTPVDPDNTDVPGRIDFGGDVDVFSVDTTGLEHLVFRVTGLALGMETLLTVYESDGVTEIASATIDQMVSGADYVALHLATGGSAELHAEVAHATGGVGTYLFSAGDRLVSDPPLLEIDIKPGTDENPIHPNSLGRIPVVVLGSDLVDVATLDPDSLAFGPEGAPAVHPRGGPAADFDDDGHLDRLNHHKTMLTGIAMGDHEACLSGVINGGVPFTACDSIRTVPLACGLGFELSLLVGVAVAVRVRRRKRANGR